MPDKRPKTFEGTPIDYRSRREIDDEDFAEYCDKVFPGVPRDQIVRPRYYARDFLLPREDDDLSPTAGLARYHLFNACRMLSIGGTAGKGRNAIMRRHWRNRFERSARWWDALGSRSLLFLNQSLYVRRNKWKNVEDLPELSVCYALCIAWLSQQRPRRSSAEAKTLARAWMNEAIQAYESGVRIDLSGDVVPARTPASPNTDDLIRDTDR